MRKGVRPAIWSAFAAGVVIVAGVAVTTSPDSPVGAMHARQSSPPPVPAALVCPASVDLAVWPWPYGTGHRPIPYAPAAGVACRYPYYPEHNTGALVRSLTLTPVQLSALEAKLNQLPEV